MALNLDAIKQRIRDIIVADLTYIEAVNVFLVDPDPAELAAHLPACVLYTGSFDSPFVSGSEGKHNVNIEAYWFTSGVQELLTSARGFQVDGILQDFVAALMSRPRLMLNDNGLDFVQGDIQLIPTVRSTALPLTYPIGFSNGIPYRGFQARIIVPYRVTYEMRA